MAETVRCSMGVRVMQRSTRVHPFNNEANSARTRSGAEHHPTGPATVNQHTMIMGTIAAGPVLCSDCKKSQAQSDAIKPEPKTQYAATLQRIDRRSTNWVWIRRYAWQNPGGRYESCSKNRRVRSGHTSRVASHYDPRILRCERDSMIGALLPPNS